jgi:hypothetical protein
MTPAGCYVLGVARAVDRGDFELARWSAKQAVLARVEALLDEETASVALAVDEIAERPVRSDW